jgi:putative spermidine/putrescine transport system ATP-binding protein
MGMVFQNYSLFPNMTARDNVAFGLRVRGARGADRTAKAVELLDMVGLADSARKYPHQLSGGQQQRVALARALAIEPAVLLLDEPLSALDAKVRVAVREHITNLHVRLGTTTLFVTHDQEEALSMADRVGVMNNGKLEQIASPNELYDRPGTAFVAQFVGTMNQLPATATSSGLHLLDAELPHAHDHPAGTAVTALARPEALTITADAGGHTVVTAKTFHGPTTRITVRLHDGHTVQVDQPSGRAAAFTVGDPVALGLAPDAQLLIAPAT